MGVWGHEKIFVGTDEKYFVGVTKNFSPTNEKNFVGLSGHKKSPYPGLPAIDSLYFSSLSPELMLTTLLSPLIRTLLSAPEIPWIIWVIFSFALACSSFASIKLWYCSREMMR